MFLSFNNFLLLNGGVCGSKCINVEFILFSVRREIPNLDVSLTEIAVNSELRSLKGCQITMICANSLR